MATLLIGPGKTYATFNAAYAAAVNGDILQFDNGVYFDVWLTLTKTLTYRGPVGGWAIMDQTGWAPNGKGHVINQGNSTFEWWQFRNSVGGNGNEAGIRYESGNITLNNCWFHDNYNGIIGNPVINPLGTGIITMTNCEFDHNGHAGDGRSHNFYAGEIQRVSATNCYFHETLDANEFKSRAWNNDITNCRMFNLNGIGSWEIDFPQGGICTVTSCIIQQGVNGANPSMTDLGVEVPSPASPNPSNSISFQSCTVVNDKSSGALFQNPNGYPATWNNTSIWKAGSLTLPTMTNTINLGVRPTLDTSHPWASGSPVIVAVVGNASGTSSVSAQSVIIPPASTALYRSDTQVTPNQVSSVTAYRSDDKVVPLAATGATSFRSSFPMSPIQTRVNSVYNKPVGTASGDTLIIIMSIGGPTGLPATVTPPAGFTAITTLPAGTLSTVAGGAYRVAIYGWYKVAGGAEPTTYTVTHVSADAEGEMYCIAGGSTTVAPHVILQTGINNIVTSGPVTMTNPDGFLIDTVLCFNDVTTTPPVGFTERHDPAGPHPFYCADEIFSSSGTTGQFTTTHPGNTGGATWASLLIGVEPEAASNFTRVDTTFNKPAGVVASDTLVLLLFAQAQTTLPTFTPPTGFLPIGQLPAASHTDATGLVGAMYAWYKIAGGSEPATYTVSHTAAKTEGDLLTISGGNGAVPGRVTTSGTGTSVVSGTIPTFVGQNGHIIEFATFWIDGTGTPPTSFTERYDPPGVHGLYVATRMFPTSGAPGTITSTHANNTGGADNRWGCMVFTIESVSTGSSLRTNTLFNKPAGVVTGDTIICVMYVSAQTALPTVTPPAGFANISVNPVNTFTDGTNLASGMYAFYKIAGGAEPATYTFTHSAASTEGDMYAVAGGDGQVPKIISNSGTGTAVTTGSLNIINPNAFLIEAVYAHDDATGTPPPNFTERYDP